MDMRSGQHARPLSENDLHRLGTHVAALTRTHGWAMIAADGAGERIVHAATAHGAKPADVTRNFTDVDIAVIAGPDTTADTISTHVWIARTLRARTVHVIHHGDVGAIADADSTHDISSDA